MSVVGIVAEFNPLHKGHEFLINEAKKLGTVVCAISGNFVQRGDVAIFEKGVRAKAALNCGADLVVELPVLWSMSTAQNFSLGAVTLLKNCGCDTLMFGSEEGDEKELIKAAQILLSKEFSSLVKEYSARGITFAKARQNAAEELGAKKGILDKPNNNLAVEYIVASLKEDFKLTFKTVKRKGADHDSLNEDEFVSASFLRDKLLKQETECWERYIPKNALATIKNAPLADIKQLDRAILTVLRTKTKDELKALPDLSEGVENKLFSAVKSAGSLENLYDEIKVKRYTEARVRRLVLSAFLGFDNSFFMKPPPYMRILGFSNKGKELLSKISKSSEILVITKASDIKTLDSKAQKVFKTESRATDIFGLAVNPPINCGLEHTRKIIKT